MDTVRQQLAYFIGIFLAAFLLLFGLGLVLMLIWPHATSSLLPQAAYYPKLPLAEAREEPLYDAAAEQARVRSPYPALTETESVHEGNWIHIPSIDVHVPLVMSASMRDTDVLQTLDAGAALYPNGIEPGRLGNTFISAHSTGEPWKGAFRFAFLRINELSDGSILHLDYGGTRYTYRISKTDIITPTSDFLLPSGRPVPTVTLMACWPLWSTKQRMLVHGSLIHITKLTPLPV